MYAVLWSSLDAKLLYTELFDLILIVSSLYTMYFSVY